MKDGQYDRRATGRLGEAKASEYLQSMGHVILQRNWRSSHLELDMITATDHTLHIVEVKTRRAPVTADPEENITRDKKARMVRAAQAFIHSKDHPVFLPGTEIVFDVLTVILDGGEALIQYYPGAFVPTYI